MDFYHFWLFVICTVLFHLLLIINCFRKSTIKTSWKSISHAGVQPVRELFLMSMFVSSSIRNQADTQMGLIDLIPKVKIGPWPCDCGFIGRTNWFLQCWDFLLSKLKSNWPSIPRQERYIKGCFMSANTLLLFDSLGSYSALGEAAQ